MGQVIAITNQKGGVGKTTTAYTGTSGRQFRKHPDTKPEASGHFAG